MKLRNILIVIYSFSLIVGCQSGGVQKSTANTPSPLAQDSAYPSSPAIAASYPWPGAPGLDAQGETREVPDDLWNRIQSELSWQNIDNRQVARAVDSYVAQPGYMPEVSERGSLYLYYIVEEVQKRNMPMEIALVPLVESTLDPFAYSPGRAAGLWQIMPATGEHLGLQQDWWFDGRRAVRDSTQVALNYLEMLYGQFDNDWLLALAAYNAGEGRVARARKKNREQGLPTDFWSLDLPLETRRYVPRVLALSKIIAEPEVHSIEMPEIANEPAFEVAQLSGQIDLTRAAQLADVSTATLRELNPGQLRWATAPEGPQELLVPVGTSTRFEEALADLTPAERVRWRHYTIRRGDSLSVIARKFHTDVGLLRRANGLSSNKIRAGASLMIPSSDWSAGLAIADSAAGSAAGYTVRKGDSLARIAGRHKVSIADIVAWNKLDPGKYLQPGQTLTLRPGGG